MWTYLAGPQWAKRFLLTGDLMSGADAARIGLMYRAVPEAALDDELDLLADKMSQIDVELLAVNKRTVNLSLELMGARTMQRLAAELDARGHLAPAEKLFYQRVEAVGVRQAIRERDAKFGDSRVTASYVRNG
jgi:enoyl-CoA hydratase